MTCRGPHWFTVYREPGHKAPTCQRCAAPNPRWNPERFPCCEEHLAHFAAPRVVRIKDLATSPVLDADEKIKGLAWALEESAILQGLSMIHGKERAVQRYKEVGGHVRFDVDGEPVVVFPWPDA